MEKPLVIAVGIVMHNNKVLLLKRNKEPYAGVWSFPGGKIEFGENIGETAIREIQEETGIQCTFAEHYGVVSEKVIEDGNITHHFLIHLCKLIPETEEIKQSNEGEVAWIDWDVVTKEEVALIPSDTCMINKMILKKEKTHYESVMEKQGNLYVLKKFE